MHLILLTLALVLFVLAGLPYPAPYEPWRYKLIAWGLAAWVASAYPF